MHGLKIFIVNGCFETGKDAFVDFCIDELEPRLGVKVSSVDAVKKAALQLGWDGRKDAKGRKFLSDLKDMATATYDGPMHHLAKAVQYCEERGARALFLMVREPPEIARFIKEFPGTKTILVERPGDEKETSNHADANVAAYNYDLVISNDKDLMSLRETAREFLQNEVLREIK